MSHPSSLSHVLSSTGHTVEILVCEDEAQFTIDDDRADRRVDKRDYRFSEELIAASGPGLEEGAEAVGRRTMSRLDLPVSIATGEPLVTSQFPRRSRHQTELSHRFMERGTLC